MRVLDQESATTIETHEPIQNPRVHDFKELLALKPEVMPLPPVIVPRAGDSHEGYTDRASMAEVAAGIYMMDPDIGPSIVANPSTPPNKFSQSTVKNEIDTRGVTSGNGFFALELEGEGNSTIALAFRPFEIGTAQTPEDDFTRNLITRFIGLENTQTVGLYKDTKGGGGTISLLDRSLRPVDRLATGDLDEKGMFGKIFRDIAREVAYAHALGVAHGDLALRNVVLQDSNSFLIDWGKSRSDKSALTNGPVIAGTKMHDLISLRDDFVDFRPSIEGRDAERTEYRKLFIEQFYDSYTMWRQEFNGAHIKTDGLIHSKDLKLELARCRDLLMKR